ncbi:MAG: twin-arginine translocation pathway signal protein [Rhodobacteraceae bacterium]|nr:twin-arginine translocation pathway signal protein [Paracoccaceae bacterium]
MTLSRRQAITLIGGGTIFAASAAAAGFLTTRTPTLALAPWENAGGYDDPRKRALSFALLVPNPHNLQPWIVDLEGTDGLALYQDQSRKIPHTDPFDRQITIGLGCFLEQLVIAASADGYAVDLTLFPDGPDGAIARAVFSPGAKADPLASAIMDRRSCKEAYAETLVSERAAKELAPYADVITDSDMVQLLRDLTWEAFLIEMYTPHTLKESVDLMRFGKAEINANPDGISLGGPFLESLMLAGILNRKDQTDPESIGFQKGLEIFNTLMMATPAYAVLTSDGNTRVDQITTGRRWLRLNLATTQMGLSLHPVSQCLQEYPEMADQYAQVHDLLAAPGQTVQMLGRLGYGPKTAPSPRWPLETRLRNA